MPFKYRHITPHKTEKSFEAPPLYLKVLKQLCEDKQNRIKHRQQRTQKDTNLISKPTTTTTVEISPLGPEHSPCFVEVFKLKNKLAEVRPVSILFSNKRAL